MSPPHPDPRPAPLSAFAFAAMLVGAALAVHAAASFSWYAGHAFLNADTWAVYDMARSVGERFYEGKLIRQFHLPAGQPSDAGASYPFLAPLLVWVVDAATGMGVYSHYLITALAGWGALALAAVVLVKAGGEGAGGTALLSGALLAVLGFGIEELYRDIHRASTIPLTLLFILGAVALLPARGGPSPRRALAAGLCMGLAAATRFDVNLLVLASVAMIPVLAERRRVAATAAYAGGVALAMLPWVVFSLAVFGRAYASDNAIVAIGVRQLHSLQVLMPDEPTLFTDFGGWLARVSVSAADFLAILRRMLADNPVVWLFLAAVPGIALAAALAARGRRGHGADAGNGGGTTRYRLALTVLALASLLMLVGPVVTGYQMNTRYYSITIFLWALMLLAWAQAAVAAAARRGAGGVRVAHGVVLLVLCAAAGSTLPRTPFADGWPALRFDEANRRVDPDGFFQRCVPADGRTLLLYRWSDMALQDGIRFGVLARRTVLILPNEWAELPSWRKRSFLREQRVSHVVLDEAQPRDGLVDPAMTLEPVSADCPGLYRLADAPGGG